MDQTPIICDYGSGFSKVGFAGNEAPLSVFPTIIGKLKHNNLLVGTEEEDCFIGAEAQNNLVQLNLNHPITRGAIANWDNVEKIWHHSFYQALHISPEQHPVMITEPPLNSKDVKSRMTQPAARGTHEHLGSVCHLAGQHANLPPQILFETFNVPALYMANQGVLSMYAAGRTSADREYIRDLKEKHCYVALDYDMEISKTAAPSCQKKFQLPDGKEVSMGQEAFMCSEALFNTSLIGKSNLGIHIQAQESITSCDRSYWKTLFSHIMVSGGTGAFSGLRLRLQREITNLASPDLCVKVAISPYAKYGAWVGASILCSLPMFKDMWVTSQEYREIGPSVMCRRNL
nr:actin, muscle-like isoform X4 [Peromyscus maniculatus bairdii]